MGLRSASWLVDDQPRVGRHSKYLHDIRSQIGRRLFETACDGRPFVGHMFSNMRVEVCRA